MPWKTRRQGPLLPGLGPEGAIPWLPEQTGARRIWGQGAVQRRASWGVQSVPTKVRPFSTSVCCKKMPTSNSQPACYVAAWHSMAVRGSRIPADQLRGLQATRGGSSLMVTPRRGPPLPSSPTKKARGLPPHVQTLLHTQRT